MEKRLRSSLRSSPEDFLSSAANLNLKSSKLTLKSLIHSVSLSSPIASSLPSALHRSITDSILSFQNLLDHPDPAKSPPSKRHRRSSRSSKSRSEVDSESNEYQKQQVLDHLHVFAHIARLCAFHPGNAISHAELLPAVRALHDNLRIFESDAVLSNEIASLCEEWWKEDLPEREMLVSQTLPFLLSRSLTLQKKVDVHRVYSLRDAFNLFDFEDESIEDLKMLLMRCVIAPLYLKTEDGRKFLAFIFGLSSQHAKEALAMIKSQIPFGRKSMLEAYGDVLFRAWKGLEGDLRNEIEDGFLQGLVDGAIHARSEALAASIRRVLGGFINQRTTDGVEKLLFRLAEPVIFRSLQVANSNVRQNALYLLLDLFPLEDPDVTKEVKDTLLDKQFFLLERLLMDDCPDVRVVAVEGCCRILHLFWEIIPSPTITKMLTKVFDEMSHDLCSEVRLSSLNGIIYLLGNPQSHEILKVLLPRLKHLMLDKILIVRVALVDLLLLLRDNCSFQFNKVVDLSVLLNTLATDQSPVAQKITRLLLPSYFPSRLTTEEACNRCVTLMMRSPLAGARFCEFALLEGASPKSLMQLVKVFVGLILSNKKLEAAQIEGLLVASSNICSYLVTEPSQRDALKELFSGEKVKCLFAAASAGRAQSSIFNIASTFSSENGVSLLEDCMGLVTDCSDLSKNVEKQAEVRSAHKLLVSCDALDDMLEVLTRHLQKTAYRCHIKFGTEVSKQSPFSVKRKKCKVKNAKWKHVSGKKSSNFEDDYSVAVGISWQIKDLLALEDTRKAILGSQAMDHVFAALKVLSEVSIVQCMNCEYMDPYPILAYTGLALHMADSSRSTSEAMLDQVINHLLVCTDKLFGAGDSGMPVKSPSDTKQENGNRARHRGSRHREPKKDASSSSESGSVNAKQQQTSSKVKVLTAVLKFIIDSIAMDFVPHLHGSCLKFTSAHTQNIISAMQLLSINKPQLKEENSKDIIMCLRSSFSYAAKLLNLVLKASSEASEPPNEALKLVNDLLDLTASSELYLGSSCTSSLITAAKPWVPDLILALGSACMLKQSQAEEAYSTVSSLIKLGFPSWPQILAKIELSETSEGSLEEEGDHSISEPDEFSGFKRLMETIVSLLKGKSNLLDAVGLILLTCSVVGLERKDFGLVLGLLHFVCVKLIGQENKEWNGLDMMLVSLPDIYPHIEREMEEQSHEEERNKLQTARALLEPVWMYHVYETGRFSVMEE
ncbi:hypothetical protein SLEP1_g8312 [Rubroshorea leprosula]|uniref:Condensin-2 complex subunit G2 n=1 Tax=Rubroshorea leprosula TaxID=152421 RepID=A0AAV5I5U3_9ROSI|nr:hypothetical protein SLEP1_g8312 [Rubroshorea leprosula]